MGVGDWFGTFCENLTIPTDKRSSISGRYQLITRRLNLDFWNLDSTLQHSFYGGSYGRGTAINGFSDLDMLFELPSDVYYQYDSYSGNGQSALLQAVRNSIKKTYTVTDVSADGQVVEVPFDDGIRFEVVPCFLNKSETYTYPDSNDGGKWKTTNPKPEIAVIAKGDQDWNGNLKRLARMIRAWKNKWSVPMGGLLIDTFAHRFLGSWSFRDKSFWYYDWMSRDFFDFLSKEDDTKAYWYAVGSNQQIRGKGNFSFKAKQCYNISLEAIEKENSAPTTAKSKWRDIYGTQYPD